MFWNLYLNEWIQFALNIVPFLFVCLIVISVLFNLPLIKLLKIYFVLNYIEIGLYFGLACGLWLGHRFGGSRGSMWSLPRWWHSMQHHSGIVQWTRRRRYVHFTSFQKLLIKFENQNQLQSIPPPAYELLWVIKMIYLFLLKSIQNVKSILNRW